jgi:general secretion pathway protein D/MSHA biogenesis protein MshL
MKKTNWCMVVSLLLLLAVLSACGAKKRTGEQGNKEAQGAATAAAMAAAPAQPAQLPARYQSPGYLVAREDSEADLGEEAEEYQIKVGATIRSTGGPQPLWDVLKRLAGLKGMTVSWASDVNQNALVDVDIASEDDFFAAIDNLLRQVDYFHEVKGKTIIVSYRETRVYQVGIPSMKGGYTTTVGGNFLAKRDNKAGGSNTGTEGTVKITSDQNEFDIWENIKLNLDTILEVWSIRREVETTTGIEDQEAKQATRTYESSAIVEQTGQGKAAETTKGGLSTTEKERVSGRTERTTQAYYTIDKSVGLISVTAPRPLLEKVDQYVNNLKKELYKQVSLEAKIIEVYLQDNSRIGLDWSKVLKNFSITGTSFFGTSGFGTDETGRDGQVYPWIKAEGDAESVTRFVSKVTMNPLNFTVLLNALNEQGDTHVLANPKITVMNGQPALLSVGKDIAYIKTVTKDVDSDTNETTYTAEVDNVVQGVALGVMASVLDNKKIILHLTPITTNLEGDDIPYRTFGDEGLEVGLPRVNIRQMSTMVEVQDGEMLIIGGLIDSVEGKSGSFAPIVGSIPVIKYLFGVEEKRKEKRELVILLAPKVI